MSGKPTFPLFDRAAQLGLLDGNSGLVVATYESFAVLVRTQPVRTTSLLALSAVTDNAEDRLGEWIDGIRSGVFAPDTTAWRVSATTHTAP